MTMKPFLFSIALLSALSLAGFSGQVQAASATQTQTTATPKTTFTAAEQDRINHLKQLYRSLDQTQYSSQTIYATPTNLNSFPFRVGSIKTNYIKSTTDWVNYYRELAGLPAANTTPNANQLSQIGASVLAGVNANPMLSQHGLINSTRPAYIDPTTWQQAQTVTNDSNLYFKADEETAGKAVSNLVADNTNIDGNDTGHRAWVLSPYLHSFGIGAAYGDNNWKYEDMLVMNNDNNVYESPSKAIVTYPSAGVFPIEELTNASTNHHAVPWSIYFASDQTTSNATPTISITDNTTQQQVTATNVLNASYSEYGYFKNVFTFAPGNLPMVSGHQYTVNVQGLKDYPAGYQYSFKLFNIQNQPPQPTDKGLNQIDIVEHGVGTVVHAPYGQTQLLTAPINGITLNTSIKDGTSWKTYGKTLINGQYFYNLGNNQWANGRFLQMSDTYHNGTLQIIAAPGKSVPGFDSPYYDQKATGHYYANNSTWRYNRVINIGGFNWYQIGQDQWVSDAYVNVLS